MHVMHSINFTLFSFAPFHNAMVFEQPNTDRQRSTWMCKLWWTIASPRGIQQICILNRRISNPCPFLRPDTLIMAQSPIHIVDRQMLTIADSSWSLLLDLLDKKKKHSHSNCIVEIRVLKIKQFSLLMIQFGRVCMCECALCMPWARNSITSITMFDEIKSYLREYILIK